jgi:shikimate dehydrogenase
MRSPTIYGHTHIVGLIGWPIEHSVSPPMHNAAFAALGLDWCYVPFPVHPNAVAEALYGVRALGLRGINATVPHKRALVPLVDELTPAASAIGAVNTVIVREGRLIGHNTDAAGFLRALQEAGFEPKGCSALVLGAGGAARAVVYALASVGAQVQIVNRTPERAASLAAEFAGVDKRARLCAGPLNAEALSQIASEVQLVVNSTPLGMWPEVESSPWPEAVPYPTKAMLYDLIYNPRETQLMRRARDAGATAVNGLRMLVHQGAEAFELWTGVRPPVDVMYAACCAALGGG